MKELEVQDVESSDYRATDSDTDTVSIWSNLDNPIREDPIVWSTNTEFKLGHLLVGLFYHHVYAWTIFGWTLNTNNESISMTC